MLDFINHLLSNCPSWLYNSDPRINEAWIPLAIAAVQLGAQMYGSAKSAQARNKMSHQLARKRSDLQNQMSSELSKDYLDTDVAKSSLKKLKEMYSDNMTRLEGNGAKQGLTEEAKVTAAGGMNKSYADAVSQIAAQGTAYKDNQRRYFQGKIDSLDGMIYGNESADAGKWSEFGNNVANAGGAAMQAYSSGAFGNGSTSIAKAQGNLATSTPIQGIQANQIGQIKQYGR